MNTEEILGRVARGELTPEQALPLLDAAADTEARPTTAPGAVESALDETVYEPGIAIPMPSAETRREAPRRSVQSHDPTTTIRIHASYRTVDVIADPSVRQVAVTGQHTIRRDGDVLIVESRDTPFSDGRQPWANFSFADLPRGLAWARQMKDYRLVVRVNPELAVEVESSGANLTVSHLSAPTRLRLVACSAKLDRLRAPLQIDAFTASIKGTMIATGQSRLTCESSSVKVHLDAGSDVTLSASNRIGKVVLPHDVSDTSIEGEPSEVTLGQGRGEFTIDAVMSSVTFTSDEHTSTETSGASS